MLGGVVNPSDVLLGDGQVGSAAEEDAVPRQSHGVLRRLLEPKPDMSRWNCLEK